jgi:hypothetical protein
MEGATHNVLVYLLNQGLAVALLLITLFAVWRGGSWCATAFLVPLRDAAVKHLQGIEESFDRLTACLTALGAETKQINTSIQRIEKEMERNNAQTQLKASASHFQRAKNNGSHGQPNDESP